ncbi:MAG: ATP-dependent Clp protease ATP-binding subunit [Patescibacteria group bacterium]
MLEAKISQKLTSNAKKCLKEAGNLAFAEKSAEINPDHLLHAIFFEESCLGSNILKNIGISKDLLKKNATPAKKYFPPNAKPEIEISPELKIIITKAYFIASNLNYPYVGTEHLVYAILESNDLEIKKILQQSSAKEELSGAKKISSKINMDNILKSSMITSDSLAHLSKIFDLPDMAIAKNSKSSPATPYLNQFCVDLNKEVERRKEIIVGREKEIERVVDILGRKNKNNPVLIGDPGVGKTAIVSKLAQKINEGSISEKLADKRILSLDMALVVAGTSFRGEFEARIKEIIKEASENKNIILFIDEIHSVVGAGNLSGGLDAANILKPALSKGEIQCIGATTFSEYKKHFEKDPALERRFQPIKIQEPSLEETKSILEGIKKSYEKFHNVSITGEAIEQAVNLSSRYINNRFLPDKAIDLIDETASSIRNRGETPDFLREMKSLENERNKVIEKKNYLVNEEKYDEALLLRQKEKDLSARIEKLKNKQKEKEKEGILEINDSDIAETVSRITGIPSDKFRTQKSTAKIKNLEKNLDSKIIGQKEATKKISDTLVRSSSGIANPDRPLGSFLFLGPTGVGKTLTAKILAQDFFGSSQNLVRIDMSELMERHNVSRLIGAPAGYVGYEEGGKLTEKIRHQPYSVVLFDEIEKAHPDVFNILLQILEDGTLTDAEGKEINFKNTVIILTSNLGTSEFTDSSRIGFSSKSKKGNERFEEIRDKVIGELKRQIKPEIINRLDHIVVFSPLSEKSIKKISRLEMEKFKKRLGLQGISMSYSGKIISFIAKKSLAFDQGARLVRRNIQELVENKIAKEIVEGKVKNNKISLDIKDDKIIVL